MKPAFEIPRQIRKIARAFPLDKLSRKFNLRP